MSYRSKSFDYGAIQQVEERPFWRAVLDRSGWPCRVLSWNPFGRGVHLKTSGGSYYFRCRDDVEMVEEFDQRRSSVERSTNGSPPSSV